MEFIDEKRQQLNEQSEHIMAEIGSAKPTIVDKFGKFRKHDGTLNTRQVYDLLRNEEKKHERVNLNTYHQNIALPNVIQLIYPLTHVGKRLLYI